MFNWVAKLRVALRGDAAQPTFPDRLEPQERIRRFEVIDHRTDWAGGRRLAIVPCQVTLAYQDDGRTLKVFIDDPVE